MDKTLQLIFTNLGGSRVTVSIPEPLDLIDPVAVELAMDQIIAANVIISTGGGLVGKVRAVLVSRDSQDIVEF